MSAPHSTATAAAVVQGLIAGFGLFGNALVLFVFVMGKDKQDTSSVIYILNLAVADFLYLFTVPFSISAEVTLQWIFGDVMCKIGALVLYLNFLVSPLFLMVMSIDRCISVYRAVTSASFRSTRVAKRISIGVWLVGLAIVTCPAMFHQVNQDSKCAPTFPGRPLCDSAALDICLSSGDFNFNTSQGISVSRITPEFTATMSSLVTHEQSTIETTTMRSLSLNERFKQLTDRCLAEVCPNYNPNLCMSAEPPSLRIWTYLSFVLNYFLPCAVIVVCYAALLHHIYKPSAISTSTSSGGGINDERKKRATLVVALLVISYFICFTPYYVWQVMWNVGVDLRGAAVCSHARRIIMTLADFNSAINPILYPFIGNQFRAKFKLALRRLRRKTKNSRLGSIKTASLRRRRSDSNRHKALRDNVCNHDNYVIKEADEQQLIEIHRKEARENVTQQKNFDNDQVNNRPVASPSTTQPTSQNASGSSNESSGCLSCFRNGSYVCPECIQEKGDFESQHNDATDDQNQSGVNDDVDIRERLKLCKKHRNSEPPSSAVATAKQSRGGWRYASSLSESKFTTEVSSMGANL